MSQLSINFINNKIVNWHEIHVVFNHFIYYVLIMLDVGSRFYESR